MHGQARLCAVGALRDGLFDASDLRVANCASSQHAMQPNALAESALSAEMHHRHVQREVAFQTSIGE